MRAISKIDKSLDQPLGRYQLIALLGQGGMADVYLACTQGPGGFQKLLVVKLARFTGDPMLSRMFLDEARLAAQLSHPNVVQTFEVGEEGSRHYMVMEYLDGATLSRLRQRASHSGGVPLRFAVQIIAQVLEGLEYAHQARGIDGKLLKVVHRDLTPSNIVITAQGVPKILDFGIAKAVDSYSFTQAGRYSGKLAYMPPEQLRAERVDERADIFSVGVILAESALGMRFWGNATEPMVAARLISGELPSFENAANLDPELRQICERALTPDREDRYPNATAFKDDLNRFLNKLGGPAPREELGEYICKMVSEERAKLQAVVDSQLQQGNKLPLGSEPAFPELPRIEPTPPMRSAVHSAATVKHEMLRHDSVDVMITPAEPPTEHSALPPSQTSAPASQILPVPAVGSHGFGRLGTLAAIGGGVAVAVLASLWLFRSEDKAATSGQVAQPPVAASAPVASGTPVTSGSPLAAPTTGAPAAEAPVRFEVVVSPPGASITLDGQPLGSNPYVGTYARDAEIHELEITAPGYQPLNQRFVMDRDRMLQLHLQKAPQIAREDLPARQQPVRGNVRRGAREAAPAQELVATPPSAPVTTPERPDSKPERGDKPSGKRALDGDVFDSKPTKRALDSDVFESAPKKLSIDRETPWKK